MANKVVLDLYAGIGKSAVYLVDELDTDDDSPLLLPVANINRVMFHSDLEYLRITRLSATLSFLAVSSGGLHTQSTIKHSIFGAHGLGSIPLGILLADGVQVPAGHRVQSTANSGGRYIFLGLDATDAFISELRITSGIDLPAVSIDFQAVLLSPITTTGSDLFDINPSAGLVQLGNNKFTNDAGYKTIKVKATGAEFYLSPPKTTIAHQNTGAMRIVWPDGTIDDHGTYTGGFTGPAAFGVGE